MFNCSFPLKPITNPIHHLATFSRALYCYWSVNFLADFWDFPDFLRDICITTAQPNFALFQFLSPKLLKPPKRPSDQIYGYGLSKKFGPLFCSWVYRLILIGAKKNDSSMERHFRSRMNSINIYPSSQRCHINHIVRRSPINHFLTSP